MKTILYILLILFILSFVFICFLWFIYYGSGHTIPIETNRWLLSLTIVDVFIIIALFVTLNKISKNQ
jgi:hypothetical protein